MAAETVVGPAGELTPGTVRGAGRWAVGNVDGVPFAVSRRCRHLGADLAKGSIDRDGCLVCPWHGARYDVTTGRMRRRPQGLFAKIPGVDRAYQLITSVLPLRRGEVVERTEWDMLPGTERPFPAGGNGEGTVKGGHDGDLAHLRAGEVDRGT